MSADATLDLRRRRFTVDEYERMGQAGILGEDDRVELIDGEILEMSPIGPPHAAIVNRLTRLLVRALDDRAVVAVQNPLRMRPRSEPQPDIVVARPRDDFYAGGHPEPGDTLLVVEVADTSLAFDRAIKLPLYARAGIREVWIVDVAARRVFVHRDAAANSYRTTATAAAEDALTCAAFPDVPFAVVDILGAP
jgi:Uma2 family endonuclease